MKITVLILAQNSAESLAKAISSVQSQTRPAEEIVIVDNGSTDATSEIAKCYDDVVLLRQNRQDTATALGNAVLMAEHKWLLLLKAEETLPHDAIERHMAVHAQVPDLKVSYETVALTNTMFHRSVLDTVGLLEETDDEELLWSQIASGPGAAAL